MKPEINAYVRTPRFCTVRINAIFCDKLEAWQAGYKEPTYYTDPTGVEVFGKCIGDNRMVFAAVVPAAL